MATINGGGESIISVAGEGGASKTVSGGAVSGVKTVPDFNGLKITEGRSAAALGIETAGGGQKVTSAGKISEIFVTGLNNRSYADNYQFFSEDGRGINMSYEDGRWRGKLWFPETSNGLYESKALYLTEKFFNTEKSKSSFRYPTSNQKQTIRAFWKEESHDDIFLYKTKFLESPVERFLDPMDVATTGPVSIEDGIVDLDGYTLSEGDRVLVKDQADARENGLYEVSFDNSLTRLDGYSSGRLGSIMVRTKHGITHGGSLWRTEPIYDDNIIGEGPIVFERVSEQDANMNRFVQDSLALDRTEIVEHPTDDNLGSRGHRAKDGLMHGTANEEFYGPMEFFIGFRGSETPERERTLIFEIEETGEIFAEIECYGASVDEDLSLRNFLDNIGKQITKEDLKYFKEFDIKESEPDFSELNAKRKELTISWHDIFPHLGSYRALIYAIKFFGYDDLKVKEYYRNTDDTSLNFGKQLHSKPIEVYDEASPEYDNLLFSAPGDSETNIYEKTNLLGLFYNLNEPDTYKFETDEDGIPVLPYTHAEMVIKLFGLKEKLHEEYLPMGTEITDVVGEGWYMHNYRMYHSTKDTIVDSFTAGITPEFEYTTYNKNSLGVWKAKDDNLNVPTKLEFDCVMDGRDIEDIREARIYAVHENGEEINTEWHWDVNNIQSIILTKPGKWELYAEVRDWYNSTTLYKFDNVLELGLMDLSLSVINDNDRIYGECIRPLDTPDNTFHLDFGNFFAYFYETIQPIRIAEFTERTINYIRDVQEDGGSVDDPWEVDRIYREMGHVGRNLFPLVCVPSDTAVSVGDLIRFSLESYESVYETLSFEVINKRSGTITEGGENISVQFLYLEDWDPVISDDDIGSLHMHILPDPGTFLKSEWDVRRLGVTSVTAHDGLTLGTNFSYEVFNKEEKETYQMESDPDSNPWEGDYYLTLDVADNIMRNSPSEFVLDLAMQDRYGNVYTLEDELVIKIKGEGVGYLRQIDPTD